MSFVIGLVLFVPILGALDGRLPWPRPRSTGAVRS